MSTIFGYIGNQGKLANMKDALRHWLPDREAAYESDVVSLAILELFNVPESPLTPQPYRYKNFIIVADCRIDNRTELAADLDIADISKHSDIEFIVRAYDKWGDGAMLKLIGDFAFVIWDENKNELFAAVDHMGIKPWYYGTVDGQFVFASEIKGITAFPGYQKEINDEFIANLFAALDYPCTETIYANVKMLAKGHFLKYKHGEFEISKYWELGCRKVTIPTTPEEQEREFNRLAIQSVTDRLRSYKKIGAEVSGGLDSTGIAAIAMEFLGKGTEFYSYSFGGIISVEGRGTDTEIVKEFCEKYDISSYLSILTENDLDAKYMLQTLIKVYDNYETNLVPSFALSYFPSAKKNNVGVILSGWAGDQMVTNTVGGFYENLAREGRYLDLWKDIRRAYSFIESIPRVFYYMYKERNKNGLYQKNLQHEKQKVHKSLLKKEWIKQFKLDEKPAMLFYLRKPTDLQTNFKVKMRLAFIQERMFNSILLAKHFNAEFRFPMVDIRLLEYIYQLPIDTIAPKGKTRYLYKKFIKGYVPNKALEMHKSKVGSVPFIPSFYELKGDEIRTSLLQAEKDPLWKYIDKEKFQVLCSRSDLKVYREFLKLFFLSEKL